MAQSAADYIQEKLYWVGADGTASFSYPLPSVRVPIHNANLLAAALLCRVSRLTGNPKYLAPALRVARYSASRQRPDGSWVYGEGPKQQWIDNFHTGFNLTALQDLGRDAGTTEFQKPLELGLEFFRRHFITSDGAARYFHDKTHPVDVHSVAQTIITLLTVGQPDQNARLQACAVFRWAHKHLWDDRGFFYYQKRRHLTVRIPYMRWSQSWMALAMSVLIESLTAQDSHAGDVPHTRPA